MVKKKQKKAVVKKSVASKKSKKRLIGKIKAKKAVLPEKKDFIDQFIEENIGENSIPVVRILRKRKNVTEAEISNIIKKDVNFVRNILYRLYEQNIVSFVRKKNVEKGWYVYFWNFKLKRAAELAQKSKIEKYEVVKKNLEEERSGSFYTCVNKCVRVSFDQAFDFSFKCPECGELLNIDDNKQRIVMLEKELVELEKGLKLDKEAK